MRVPSHVETVVLLGWKDVDEYIYIDYEPDHHQKKRGRATYQQIKEYVMNTHGLHVSSLDIAQIKDKCGFEKRDNYNKGKEGHPSFFLSYKHQVTIEDWEAGRRTPPEYIPRLIAYQLKYEELTKKGHTGKK